MEKRRLNRRDFLRIVGAGAGTALLAACGKEVEVTREIDKIVKETVVETVVEKETILETVIVEGTPQVIEQEVTRVVEKEVPVEKIVQVTAPPEKVTLHIAYWGSALGKTDVLESVVFPRFTEMHPHVTVEHESAPWGDYWVRFNTLAAAGDLPDVYANSPAYVWEHANRGMSVNVQPYADLDLDEDAYFEAPMQGARYPYKDDDLYAFPLQWNAGGLFYNKDMFDAEGMAYPDETWTYDDMLEAAKPFTKDTDGDGKIDQWGVYSTSQYNTLIPVIKSFGGFCLNEEYTKSRLTEPEAIEAVQWMVDLIHKHEVSPDFATVGAFESYVFNTGRVAMSPRASYMVAQYQDVDFEWDVSWTPEGPVKRVVFAGGAYICVTKQSQKRDLGWEFLKFWGSPYIQLKGDVIGLGSLPVLMDAAFSDEFLKSEGNPPGAAMFAQTGPYAEGPDYGPRWIEWCATIMRNELDLAFLGERSVEDSCAAATAEIDKVLADVDWPVVS